MKNQVEIICKNNGKTLLVEEGSSLLSIYQMSGVELPYPVLCAQVNNRTRDLSYRVYQPKQVTFSDATHIMGMRMYVHSLCFVLYKAVTELYPGTRLRIEHSVSNGYFCCLGQRGEIPEKVVHSLKKCMQEIIAKNLPFERIQSTADVAKEHFKAQDMSDKIDLIETINPLYATYYRLDGLYDVYYDYLVPSTGYLQVFDLIKYYDGMLLVPPKRSNPNELPEVIRQDKMFNVFKENLKISGIVGLNNVGDMNRAILKSLSGDLIKITEALHEKQISRIADQITKRHNGPEKGARVILISGPSSSGKTTFSKRLSIQLMTNLLVPITISLDNYFVEREETPLDENGDYDYESLYALDLKLFNRQLNDLLQGKEVSLPTYNFETGKKEYLGNTLKMKESDVLVLEGIHALNPALTPQIEDSQKFLIYVSALTTLSIDDHSWIPTADSRLLRRIIRDEKYRGTSAQKTIARWNSVRKGEEKWIFPYQENADAMFNSSLLFELAVIKQQAVPTLMAVPQNCPEYDVAKHLLKQLYYFLPLGEAEIPSTSLLREFLGGSSFNY
ncbi:MAG: nucleoside kinase [Porphyromonadaceae bacterium]|nr:nucleoside kinase [Porphyromonadaceae bacterium]